MEPERWQNIRAILERAFEVPPPRRQAFLDEACADDPTLRAEVEDLLAAEADAETLDGRLADLPGAVAAAVDAAPEVDPLNGAQIDRYRLLHRIGRGGTATVYLAERADDHYKQRVAFKLIQTRDTENLLLRFRNERQILAGLVHPNIARLLDGGRLEGDAIPIELRGRPYMVMEYVDGLPIDRHCDTNRLDVPARLRLFRTVCQAVTAAHRNLVVHRDLKPGNILVGQDGTVKLLDFGIAKVLNPELSSASLAVTQSDLRLLSPSYASPEQLLGEKITTTSDVYSLGVVLFELLSGHRPYRRGSGLQTLIGQILHSDRPRVSKMSGDRALDEPTATARRTTPRLLHRQLEGDLDAIVDKALAREPEDRYPSAQALDDDIANHLEGRPVEARRGVPFYGVRRWAQRHALGVGAATLGLLALVGALVTAVVQARSAAEARDAAERKAAIATEITEFVTGIFDSATPEASQGRPITARALLDNGALRVRAELGGSPEIQASLLHVIGRAYLSLGLLDDATRAFDEALALRRELFPEGHPDIALTQRHVARMMTVRGRFDAASSLHRESIATLESQTPVDRLEVARGLSLLSYSVGLSGDIVEAEDLRRRSLALRREILGDDHPEVAQGWNDLGHVLLSRGQLAAAEDALVRARDIRLAHLGDRHPDLATAFGNLAKVYLEAGRIDEAEAAIARSVAIARSIFDPLHPRLAISLETLARVRLAAGRLDEAEAAGRESLSIFAATYPSGLTRMGLTWGRLSEVALQRGDLEAASQAMGEASRIMDRITPPGHFSWVDLWIFRGRWLLALGRYDEAEAELGRAIDSLRTRGLPAGVSLRRAAEAMIELYEATERDEDAESFRPLAAPPRL